MKLVAFILSLLVLSASIVPCYVIDNCDEEEHTAGTTDKEEDKDCTGCSPFSICSAESGVTVSYFNPSIEPVTASFQPVYCDFSFSFQSEYHSSLFQPPRCI